MEIRREDIRIDRPDGGTTRAYSVRPSEASEVPGLVVVHETWGLDEQFRAIADRLAGEGFAVIAPDLLWMDVQIPTDVLVRASRAVWERVPPEEWQVPGRAASALSELEPAWRPRLEAWLMHSLAGPTPAGLAVIDASIAALRGSGSRRVGLTGLCFGGSYTWSFAFAGGAADAFVPFYGRVPEHRDPGAVRGAVLGVYGGADPYIPIGTIEAAAAELRAAGREATVRVFEGAGHAFMSDARDTYHPEAAGRAWVETLAFLRRLLA